MTWFGALGLLVQNVKWNGWSCGFGTVSVNALVTITTSLSLISNVLIANTPQLLIYILYLFYNNIFTRMLLSAEYTPHASKWEYPACLGTRGPAAGDVPRAAAIPICSVHAWDGIGFCTRGIAVTVPLAWRDL